MNTVRTELTKRSSDSLPTSFSSLPYDIVVNILARISRNHHPILSLDSKGFQSLLASRELDATRSRMGKKKDCLYVCLHIKKNQHNPLWFVLAPIPERQRLLRIPYYQHSKYSTVVSVGANICIIGGFSKRRIRSRKVLRLDCRSNQWSSLPDMIVPRKKPTAEVIDGKIYVIGGCGNEHNNIKHWGEVYNPKTQTWKLLWRTTIDHLIAQKSVVPGRLVMGGKVYDMYDLNLDYQKHICLVEIEKNLFCQITIFSSSLYWRNANQDLGWCMVTGLEGLYPNSFVSVAKLCGGRRVTVWWRCKTEIWCAEISLQRCGFEKLQGVVDGLEMCLP